MLLEIETFPQALSVAALVALVAYCAWTQHREGRILNAVTYPAAAIALITAPLIWDDWVAHVLSGLAAFALFVALALWAPSGLGMGVAKLMGVVALVLGPAAWLACVVGAATGTMHAWRIKGAVSGPQHVMAGVVATIGAGLL